jgi:hypothetical protein
MIYKKTHTSKTALNDHIKKIEARGGTYRVKGNVVEYGFVEQSKDTSIKSKNSTDLIMEAAQKGYRKVKVVFVKIKLSDFPKSTHNSASVKKVVGTQKTEIFDVVNETDDIIHLLKSKDVEKIFFTK